MILQKFLSLFFVCCAALLFHTACFGIRLRCTLLVQTPGENSGSKRSNAQVYKTRQNKEMPYSSFFAESILRQSRAQAQLGHQENAKDIVISGVSDALLRQDKPAEDMFQMEFSEISIAAEDYETASTHITRERELLESFS